MLKKQVLMSVMWMFVLGFGSSAFGQCVGHAVLNDAERSGFISDAFGNQAEVAVQLLAAEGCGRAMLDSLRGFGASVRFADEKVGYALVRLPKEKVLDALDLPGVAYALTTHFAPGAGERANVPPSERHAVTLPPIRIPFPRVATSLPKDGPYFAAEEAGLAALWRRYPEADGRGVRVAVWDEGLDLLHPSLRLAKDARGNVVPKVADVLTLSTPEEDTDWVQFGDPIQTIKGSFTAAGRTWTAPKDGVYRFGIFSKQFVLGNEPISDPKQSLVSVGVLWDERINRVWVDTGGDGNFRNQRALGDYGETDDVDYFGGKDGEDDNRIPFGIKIDPAQRAAYLSIANGKHGASIAGPLAANRLTGGLFDGAAPNAQLIDVRQPTSTGDQSKILPAILSALARKDVDVMNVSGVMGFPYDDWRGWLDFWRHVQERATIVYEKPIACVCEAANALGVWDYQSAEMLRRNRQAPPPYTEAMNSQVIYNPIGLVTTILAPSTNLIAPSRYMVLVENGKVFHSNVPAPEGYDIGSNLSPAVAVVSGILADLLSEAKREHVHYNVARLIQAVLSGTRLVEGFPTSQQGYGLIDAEGAWNQLTKMGNADDPKNPILTSFEVSKSKDEKHDEVYGFSADLPRAGGTLRGELWITRRGGYPGGRAYRFSLRGDDGTYTLLDKEVTFVRDQPVRVRLAAGITPGLHVAFLQLEDAKAGVVMQEVPFSVCAPDVPEIIAPGIEKYEATIPPRHVNHRYVRLGEETQAARFVGRIPGRYLNLPSNGPAPFVGRIPGDKLGLPSNGPVSSAQPSGDLGDAPHHVGPMLQLETLVLNTKSKTEQIYWHNRGLPEYETPQDDPAPTVPIIATLTVEKYAVAFDKVDAQTVRLSNKLANINGRFELYNAKLTSYEVKGSGSHGLATLEHTLPAHLAQWRVSVSSTSADQGIADAFLLDCTGKNGCSVTDQKPVNPNGVTLTSDEPKQGNWRIVIRMRHAVKEPGAFRVREAQLIPNYSASESADAKHASGTTWSVVLPTKVSDAQYAAFKIAGDPDNAQTKKDDAAKTGVRIAMTPLTADAP